MDDLWNGGLVDDDERKALQACDSVDAVRVQLHSVEASRRLDFFLQSLSDPKMPASTGALVAPGTSVLVPSYNEMVLLHLPDEEAEFDCRDATETLRAALHGGEVTALEDAILAAHQNGYVDAALVEEAEVQLAAEIPLMKDKRLTVYGQRRANDSWNEAGDNMLQKRQEARLGFDGRGKLKYGSFKVTPPYP